MPTPLGSRKQVFIDWTLIDAGYGFVLKEGKGGTRHMPHGVRLTAHAPVFMPESTFPADQPWEDLFINAGYSTLLQEEGRLRLYYETFSRRDRRSDLSARVCYAESEDGRRWRRDPLGLIEWDGARNNNIVYSKEIPGVIAAHGANIFKDPSAPPEERYKIIHVGPINIKGQIWPGVWASVSPDGLHWRPLDKPLMQHTSDTQNVIQYDAEAGLYRAFVRGIFPTQRSVRKGVHGRRAVDAAVTKDFRAWPEPEQVLAPAPDDAPDWDIYTNAYAKWPGADAHLMFPACYSRGSDVMQVHLAVSRDGWHWSRPQKAPLLPAGEPGTMWQGGLYAGQGIAALTETGLAKDHDSATLWAIPLAPILYTHNYVPPEDNFKTHLQRGPWLATIRPDGFMSLSAETAGECWTYPITWTGNRLRVNSWARGGGNVRVGFETKDGPVEGFTVDDCDPLEGDCLWKAVTWRGKAGVGALADRDVCLHLRLLRSRLHAFRFSSAGAP